MEKQLKGFLKASLLATLSLPMFSYCQEKINIPPELSEQVQKKYPRVFTVLLTEIEKGKDSVYIVTQKLDDTSFLVGDFIIMPQKYKLARSSSSQGKFIQGQLVSNYNEIIDYAGNLSESVYSIIKDNKDKLYAIPDENIKTISQIIATDNLVDSFTKLGYKPYRDGEDYYIKSKYCEIRLDEGTQAEIKKNPNYISNLDSDQGQIASLVKQTITHSKTLDQYLSLYRIQKSKMSTANIKAWRTATTNAQKLMLQINKLSEKYDGNYSFTLLKKSNTLDVFSDNLLASKGVLRM